MDAKDLRKEAALSDRNDGAANYTQGAAAVDPCRTKTYQDMGSSPMAKAETAVSRPCAVIGPDRVVPPAEAYPRKPPEPWPAASDPYRRPPDYPLKLHDYQHPTRNISPRQTFQENMQRIMVPPTYASNKLKEDCFQLDPNLSQLRNKVNVSTETKFCDVPYAVNSIVNDPKNIRTTDVSVSNLNSVLTRSAPQAWPPIGAQVRPSKTYSASEFYQFPDTASVAPRPMYMARPHRSALEESAHVADPYGHSGNIRFKPYPTPALKDRYAQPRYDYISNYPNPVQAQPVPFSPHKTIPSNSYPGYSQVPLKYMDSRLSDPLMNSYQRPANPQTTYNNLGYRNQVIHPSYGTIQGSCLQPNKFYPYPDTSPKAMAAKLPPYPDFEGNRPKPYPIPDGYYLNDVTRSHSIKSQVMPPNYPGPNLHMMHPHPYYRKDSLPMKSFDHSGHYRNIDPSININANTLPRFTSQFSNTVPISSDSISNNTNMTSQAFQDDFSYMNQSMSMVGARAFDPAISRFSNDPFRRYEYNYGPIHKPPTVQSKCEPYPISDQSSKDKKDLDVRKFLEMWNEGEEESSENNTKNNSKPVPLNTFSPGTHAATNTVDSSNQEQLYVMGIVNVPREELDRYEHIQKVSKLPENIKGYNSIEILHKFEEVIESSNLNDHKSSPSSSRDFRMPPKNSVPFQTMQVAMPRRALSPLDVEAKISQSIIHKEVGCNFEIKPCSPKMLNVERATPVQNIISERIIEKVSNPVGTPPSSNKISVENTDVASNVICQDQTISLMEQNIKSPCCKMAGTQYSKSDIDSITKPNYTLHDLESNSGVCLASLPRLDNDIELSFPEVNQQFINANKMDSVIMPKPLLDVEKPPKDGSEKLQEKKLNQTQAKNDQQHPKLNKYRKQKRKSLDFVNNSSYEPSRQAVRTDSVIIKNPDTNKIFEDITLKSPKCQPEGNPQSDPINLTTQHLTSVEESMAEIHKEISDDSAIDFSLHSNDRYQEYHQSNLFSVNNHKNLCEIQLSLESENTITSSPKNDLSGELDSPKLNLAPKDSCNIGNETHNKETTTSFNSKDQSANNAFVNLENSQLDETFCCPQTTVLNKTLNDENKPNMMNNIACDKEFTIDPNNTNTLTEGKQDKNIMLPELMVNNETDRVKNTAFISDSEKFHITEEQNMEVDSVKTKSLNKFGSNKNNEELTQTTETNKEMVTEHLSGNAALNTIVNEHNIENSSLNSEEKSDITKIYKTLYEPEDEKNNQALSLPDPNIIEDEEMLQNSPSIFFEPPLTPLNETPENSMNHNDVKESSSDSELSLNYIENGGQYFKSLSSLKKEMFSPWIRKLILREDKLYNVDEKITLSENTYNNNPESDLDVPLNHDMKDRSMSMLYNFHQEDPKIELRVKNELLNDKLPAALDIISDDSTESLDSEFGAEINVTESLSERAVITDLSESDNLFKSALEQPNQCKESKSIEVIPSPQCDDSNNAEASHLNKISNDDIIRKLNNPPNTTSGCEFSTDANIIDENEILCRENRVKIKTFEEKGNSLKEHDRKTDNVTKTPNNGDVTPSLRDNTSPSGEILDDNAAKKWTVQNSSQKRIDRDENVSNVDESVDDKDSQHINNELHVLHHTKINEKQKLDGEKSSEDESFDKDLVTKINVKKWTLQNATQDSIDIDENVSDEDESVNDKYVQHKNKEVYVSHDTEIKKEQKIDRERSCNEKSFDNDYIANIRVLDKTLDDEVVNELTPKSTSKDSDENSDESESDEDESVDDKGIQHKNENSHVIHDTKINEVQKCDGQSSIDDESFVNDHFDKIKGLDTNLDSNVVKELTPQNTPKDVDINDSDNDEKLCDRQILVKNKDISNKDEEIDQNEKESEINKESFVDENTGEEKIYIQNVDETLSIEEDSIKNSKESSLIDDIATKEIIKVDEKIITIEEKSKHNNTGSKEFKIDNENKKMHKFTEHYLQNIINSSIVDDAISDNVNVIGINVVDPENDTIFDKENKCHLEIESVNENTIILQSICVPDTTQDNVSSKYSPAFEDKVPNTVIKVSKNCLDAIKSEYGSDSDDLSSENEVDRLKHDYASESDDQEECCNLPTTSNASCFEKDLRKLDSKKNFTSTCQSEIRPKDESKIGFAFEADADIDNISINESLRQEDNNEPFNLDLVWELETDKIAGKSSPFADREDILSMRNPEKDEMFQSVIIACNNNIINDYFKDLDETKKEDETTASTSDDNEVIKSSSCLLDDYQYNEFAVDSTTIAVDSTTIFDEHAGITIHNEYQDEQISVETTTVELIDDPNDVSLIEQSASLQKKTSLKRSLSDSDLSNFKDSDTGSSSIIWPRKRAKHTPLNYRLCDKLSDSGKSIQNSRRNSLSSICNETNVSFCILIDNDCLLPVECSDSDKVQSLTEISEDCLACVQSDPIVGGIDSSAEIVSFVEEMHEYSNNFPTDDCTEEENPIDNSWVHDVACVETVVSDDIAEDIVIGACTPPSELSNSEYDNDDSDILGINDHSDKVKFIYGDTMCGNDAHLLDTLYRTPQMNVNKKLENKESQNTGECRFYDRDTLENVLSEPTSYPEVVYEPESVAFNTSSLYSPDIDVLGNDKANMDLVTFNSPISPFNIQDTNKPDEAAQTKKCIAEEHHKTQDDTVHSCETSTDNVFSFDQIGETPNCIISSSPEVSSTTSEEKNSSILLKITNLRGARVSHASDESHNRISCKYTETDDYSKTDANRPARPLITKAAQKYIPPLKETIPNLKVKLTLPQQSLLRLKQMKVSKESHTLSIKVENKPNVLNIENIPNVVNIENKPNVVKKLRKDIPKKVKPKFEDVLKSIEEIQFQMHKEKSKKTKKCIPRVVIKKNGNGSHYASTSNETPNPDLTGRKWQPWVFLEKSHFIDKMARTGKMRAVFSHRKNIFVLAENFKKYKSAASSKFVISKPKIENSSSGRLKYTIRLKHSY